MKRFGLLALVLFTADATASAQTPAPAESRVGIYTQASAVLAFPRDLENATGGAVAIGVTLHEVHSLEAEAMRFKSSEGDNEVTFTPILATYKYGIPLSPKWTLTLGASVGATQESVRWYWPPTFDPPNGRWLEYSNNAFTYGVTGGVACALTDHVSFEGGVKALRLEETSRAAVVGITIVSVGATYRF